MAEQRIERIISQLAELNEDELSFIYATIVEKQRENRKAKQVKAREELIKAWINFVDLGGSAEINDEHASYYTDLDFYI